MCVCDERRGPTQINSEEWNLVPSALAATRRWPSNLLPKTCFSSQPHAHGGTSHTNTRCHPHGVHAHSQQLGKSANTPKNATSTNTRRWWWFLKMITLFLWPVRCTFFRMAVLRLMDMRL